MSCSFGGLDLTDVTATIQDCSLIISGSDGRIFNVFDLNTTVAVSPNNPDTINIKDGIGNYLSISAADLQTLGLTQEDINTAATACRSASAAPPMQQNSGIPTLAEDPADPASIGAWIVGNEMRFWDGTQVRLLDTNDGDILDAFGNITGIDI